MVIQRVWRSSPSTSGSNTFANNNNNNNCVSTHAATSSSELVVPSVVVGTSESECNSSANLQQSGNNGAGGGKQQRPKLSGDAMLEVLKMRYSGRSYASQSSNDAALKSLELLRSNIQYLFDKEMDVVIKKFSSLFFVPAIKNIKENLGENAISEETLKTIYCSLLEASKAQYVRQISSPAETSLSRANTPGMELSDSDSSTDNTVPSGTTSLLQQALKRKLPEPNQPDTFKRQYFLQGSVYSQNQHSILQSLGNVQGSLPYQIRPSVLNPTVYTTTISPETLFILDFKAGRALGVADFRDRLANKHPEILRYCPDNQDREWLLQQKQISPLNRNGRFFLLVLDEVKKLAERNAEYSNNPYLKLTDLQGFKLTESVYAKVQKLIKDSAESTIKPIAQVSTPPAPIPIIIPPRPRVSSLSSSHATLTALLASPQSSAGSTMPEIVTTASSAGTNVIGLDTSAGASGETKT
ncbi:deoxynucleotidyltransferase terminal-interacting protein 1 [Topomyia yanbarensis]|uniref:deoxynucleotidyltransferase terminal-interacting protein 1 n=1 Tax=Topomyia yanbarensis TaxID=2498891 RepID=UPI00273BCFDB|nr:deoxynucleotidyltransferase terminal-interacting protein 1 [Topomyia yanbarensis]